MKRISLLMALLFAFAAVAQAGSPSSVYTKNGVKPSTMNTNGGFDFAARDTGNHTGWCKGNGHLYPPGNLASGHRNHWDCEQLPPPPPPCDPQVEECDEG